MFRSRRKRETVVLDKPRYIGMTILDITKIIMYIFHYNFIMKQYQRTKLMFTDTYSFCYQIPTEYMNGYRKERHDWFDFSNYDAEHTNRDMSNKLKPGFFKDEMGVNLSLTSLGLEAKCTL